MIFLDERVLTEYKPSCVKDEETMKKYNIKSDFEYRKFLETNAISLRQSEMLESIEKSKTKV